MYAVGSGRKDIVKLLVDKGADPNIIAWNDKTALREAVKGVLTTPPRVKYWFIFHNNPKFALTPRNSE